MSPATGADIGPFKITEVSALSAGNRRIIAVTGPSAVELFQDTFNSLKTLGTEFKVPIEQVADAVAKQKEQLKAAQSTIKELKKSLVTSQLTGWVSRIESIGSLPFLYLSLEEIQPEDLRDIGALLIQKQPALYFLLAKGHDRSAFFVTLAPTLSPNLDLKKLGAWLKEQGIQGGGSGTTLQGGISTTSPHLEGALKKWLKDNVA